MDSIDNFVSIDNISCHRTTLIVQKVIKNSQTMSKICTFIFLAFTSLVLLQGYVDGLIANSSLLLESKFTAESVSSDILHIYIYIIYIYIYIRPWAFPHLK